MSAIDPLEYDGKKPEKLIIEVSQIFGSGVGESFSGKNILTCRHSQNVGSRIDGLHGGFTSSEFNLQLSRMVFIFYSHMIYGFENSGVFTTGYCEEI